MFDYMDPKALGPLRCKNKGYINGGYVRTFLTIEILIRGRGFKSIRNMGLRQSNHLYVRTYLSTFNSSKPCFSLGTYVPKTCT